MSTNNINNLVKIFNPTGKAGAAKSIGKLPDIKQYYPIKTFKGTLEPLNEAIWMTHHRGQFIAGIYPLFDTNKTSWIAFDIDVHKQYEQHTSLQALYSISEKLKEIGIPYFVFNSKSGGWHIYCFFKEACEAKGARILAKYVSKGHKVEIFPKQDELRPKEIGNLIALPFNGYYMRERKTTMYLSSDDFHPYISPEFFFKKYEDLKNQFWGDYQIATFAADLKPEEYDTTPDISEIFTNGETEIRINKNSDWLNEILLGVPQGRRNQSACQLAGYWIRTIENKSQIMQLMRDWNQKNTPPLSEKEISQIVNAIYRKHQATNTIKKPVVDVEAKDSFFENFFILQYPDGTRRYKVQIDEEKAFILNAEELASMRKFRIMYMDVSGHFPPMMKSAEWELLVESFLQNANIIDMSLDETNLAVIRDIFITDIIKFRQITEPDIFKMIEYSCIIVEDNLLFYLSTLTRYLQFTELKGISRKALGEILNNFGAKHEDKIVIDVTPIYDVWMFNLQILKNKCRKLKDLDGEEIFNDEQAN